MLPMHCGTRAGRTAHDNKWLLDQATGAIIALRPGIASKARVAPHEPQPTAIPTRRADVYPPNLPACAARGVRAAAAAAAGRARARSTVLRTNEVAELLDTSNATINGALERSRMARDTDEAIRRHDIPGRRGSAPETPGSNPPAFKDLRPRSAALARPPADSSPIDAAQAAQAPQA